MDLGFGTAGLDFNQDPAQGIAEAVFAPDRIDQNLVDRLLSKCGEKLSILAAPAMLDRMYDFPETAFDSLIDILRATTPCVILDIPHLWTAWARRALINADEIAIVASPDLANLRNTKNMLDMLRAARAHDGHPKLIMNGVGVPKRPEISVADFAKAVDLVPAGILLSSPNSLARRPTMVRWSPKSRREAKSRTSSAILREKLPTGMSRVKRNATFLTL